MSSSRVKAESFLILAVICVPKRGLSESVGYLMTIFKTCSCKEVEIMCVKIIKFGNVCSSASSGMEYKNSVISLLWQVVCCDLPSRFQPQYFLLKKCGYSHNVVEAFWLGNLLLYSAHDSPVLSLSSSSVSLQTLSLCNIFNHTLNGFTL